MYNNHLYCLPYPVQSNPNTVRMYMCVWCMVCTRRWREKMNRINTHTHEASGSRGKRKAKNEAKRWSKGDILCALTVKLFFCYIPCLVVLVASFLPILSSYSSSFVFVIISLFFCVSFFSVLSSFQCLSIFRCKIDLNVECFCLLLGAQLVSYIRLLLYLWEWSVFFFLDSFFCTFMLTSSFIRFSSVCRILHDELNKVTYIRLHDESYEHKHQAYTQQLC